MISMVDVYYYYYYYYRLNINKIIVTYNLPRESFSEAPDEGNFLKK